MKIINQTKNTLLANRIVFAESFLKRSRGLLGIKEFNLGQALILKPCGSIHTLFMHFPIDVLFVDKNNKVIKAISNLQPFRLTPVYFNSALVIEIPVGTIQSSSTVKNDILIIN